jgi:hypothetical protein
MVIMEQEQIKNTRDKISEINWNKFITWTTLISISAIAYYSLGAYKHWKEIKKLK